MFENNADALYKAFSKALLRGNAYAFKELADRAFGRLKEKVEVDVGPYKDLSDEDLKTCIAELERQLGAPPVLPPVSRTAPPARPSQAPTVTILSGHAHPVLIRLAVDICPPDRRCGGTCQFQEVGNDSPCKRFSKIVSRNSSASAKINSQVGQVSAVPGLRGNHTLAHDWHLCSVIRLMGGAICTFDF